MSKSSVLKSTSIVGILTVASKLTGFLRDVLIANAFGTTFETDAYNMALVIPLVIFSIFGAAITTTFIPLLSDVLNRRGRDEMYDFANNVMNILMAFTLILSALGIVFAPQLVKLLAPKFSGETFTLTVLLARIAMVNLIFMSLNSGFNAILQTLEDFTGPALIGIMANLPIILYVLFGNKFGIYGLTVANVVGYGLQIAIQVPWLIKNKYKYKPIFDIREPKFKRLIYLIIPVVIGSSVNQINTVVDRTLGSGLPEGSITALNFANKVNTLVYGIFATAVVTVVYPMLSQEGMNKDKSVFKKYISKAISNISFIMFPATIGIMILCTPIVKFIFMRGAFDENSVSMTSAALIFLCVGAPFYGIRDVLNRAFYSIQDTKTPMYNGFVGVAINVVLDIILVKYMGIGGLAFATSIAAIAISVILYFSLRRKIGHVLSRDGISDMKKIIGASLIMTIFTWAFYEFIAKTYISSSLAVIIATAIIGMGVYAGSVLWLKPTVMSEFIAMVKGKVLRKKA